MRRPVSQMTPEELNALSDEAPFQRIDAIVNSRRSADYVPTNQHGLAPYITLKLLHRVHTRLAKTGAGLNGKSALTNLLGWVVMELTFVAPPPGVRDVHTYGGRISQFLKRQYIEKSQQLASRAARKRPAAERAQQAADLAHLRAVLHQTLRRAVPGASLQPDTFRHAAVPTRAHVAVPPARAAIADGEPRVVHGEAAMRLAAG